MSEKKSILFILPFMPYPLVSGGHQALYNGIKAVKDDYKVMVAYPAIDNDEYRKNESAFLEKLPGIVLLPMLSRAEYLTFCQRAYQNTKTFVKKCLGIKPAPYIPKIYERWIPDVSPLGDNWWRHLDQIFNNYSIDAVEVEMPCIIGAVYNIPVNVVKIYVHHELAFVRHELEIRQKNNSNEAKAYAEFTKMVEINLLNEYDAVVTLSEIDRQKLVDVGVIKPVYSSFAVVEACDYKTLDRVDKVLSFVGEDNHTPNYEGVVWFLSNCWKKLKSKEPSYCLQIIGRWSDKSIKYISSHFDDVSFLGYVDDLSEALTGSVMIVPITIGSGIRMKILDAAARGIPIVSTSVGVEGLPFMDGVQCYIKDTPEDFIQGILSLQDLNIAKSMCDAAFEMVNSGYSFEAFKKNRLSVIRDIIADSIS